MDFKNSQAFFDDIYTNKRNCENEERDYKLEYHFTKKKDQLNLIKDIVAFANTQGGYIIFGVTDKDYQWVGLNEDSDDIDETQIRSIMEKYVTIMPNFEVGTYQKDGNIFYLITIDKMPPNQLISMKADGSYSATKKGSTKESNLFVFKNKDIYGRVGSSCKPVNSDPGFSKLHASSTGKISNVDDFPPPFSTSSFIDRPKEFEALLEKLNNDNIRNVQINGLGGVGKTSFVRDFCDKVLANKVALSFRAHYLIWITGKMDFFEPDGKIRQIRDTKLSFSEMLKIFARVFDVNLEGKSNPDIERNIIEKLTYYPSIIVFDNMETIDDPQILEFCKKVPFSTRQIFTTRANLEGITYARIDMKGFDIDQFKLYIDAKIRTRVALDPSTYLGAISPHIEKLHSLTKGLPILIDFVLGKLCNGCDINSLINHLMNLPKEDDYYDSVMRFCFNSSFDSLDEHAIDVLFVMSISDDEKEFFTISELSYITGFKDDTINDVLEKLHGISFAITTQGKYQCPILVRAFANKKISETIREKRNNYLAQRYYKQKEKQKQFEETESEHYNRVRAYDFMRKVAVADIREIIYKYDPKDDYAKAVAEFERVRAGCQEYAYVYFERAKFECEAGNYDLARSFYEKAIKYDQTNDYYYSQFGYFLLDQAKHDYKTKNKGDVKAKTAAEMFEKALKINSHPNIYQGLARALTMSLSKEEIINRCDEISELFEKGFYPDNEKANSWRNARNAHTYATFLSKCQRLDEAKRICERGLRFSPHDRMLSSLKGSIDSRKKTNFSAANDFQPRTAEDMRSGAFLNSNKETLEKLFCDFYKEK